MRSKKGRNGEIFYEHQKYLRKIGTQEIFVYDADLLKRGDMEFFDPFASGSDSRTPRVDPHITPEEHHSNLIQAEFGVTREEIRSRLKQYKIKIHKIFYGLSILWELEPVHDLINFKPSYKKIVRLIGPTFTQDDMNVALAVFRQNPNLDFLTSEAAHDLIEDAQLGVEPPGRHIGTVPVE